MAVLADLLRTVTPEADEPAHTPDDASELLDLGGESEDADGIAADPQPARRSQKRRKTARAAAAKATKAERDQVRDALTMLYTVPAWGLRMRDAHCGGVLMDEREKIIDAMTPIVCRNPAMLAFFTAAGAPWMEYLALMQALLPVGQAVWGHHVTRTVGRPEQDGGMNGFDLSAYSAPAFG